MKTFKKSIAMLLTVLMLVSVMAVAGIGASAEEGADPAAPSENVIYFVNSDKWKDVSAYCYSTVGGEEVGWPGLPATVVDADNGIYSYAPGIFDRIIFNNNNQGLQTGNLETAGNFGKYYEPLTAKFYDTAEEAIEATKTFVPAKYYAIGSEGLFGNNWLLKDKNSAMTSLDKDTFILKIENVKKGTYEYKVNNGTWSETYPDGPENPTVTVAEDGSTVTIILDPSRGYPLAGVNETPVYPEIVETEPVTEPATEEETVAPTNPVVTAGKAQINVSSNITSAVKATYDLSRDKSFTLQFNLKAAEKILNGQGYLEYDRKVLKLESFTMPNVSNAVINTTLADKVVFNYTDCSNKYDFTSAKVYAQAKFRFIASSNTTVKFTVEELNGTGAKGDVAYVTDGKKVGTFSASSKFSTPTAPAPKLAASSAKKNAGQTYTIKVLNKPSGTKLAFTSSKKKVATVNSKGKVTALTKGKSTISVKIMKGKTVQKTLKFTMTVKTNPKLSKKTLTIKKAGKSATVKITGKASSVKNKYSVKNKKIAKVTTKSKDAKKIKIKGLKKGKTTVTIKVNGKALKLKVVVKK